MKKLIALSVMLFAVGCSNQDTEVANGWKDTRNEVETLITANAAKAQADPIVAADKDSDETPPQFTKSHLVKSKEYYELINSTPEDEKLMMDMVVTMIEPLLAPFRKLPPDQYNQIKEAYANWLLRMFKDPEWALKVQLETAKNFTEEELEGLIKFNKTPLGRKTMKTLPALMQEFQRIGKQWGTDHALELQKEIDRILKGA